VSQADFRRELERLGGTATDRQLERWRNEGLLPKAHQSPIYRADGRAAGSEVSQAVGSIQQAVAVERVLKHVRSIDRAGAILWAAGFEVDGCYWRPALARAERTGRLFGKWARRFSDPDALELTLGERLAETQKLAGVLHKIGRRTDSLGVARIIDAAADVATGEFSVFSFPASDRDESDQAQVEHALGFDDGTMHQVLHQRLNLGADLGVLLQAMSATSTIEDLGDEEIAIARDDARKAMKIAHCFYEATAWIYGRGSFGLRITQAMIKSLQLTLIMSGAVGIARLRRRPNRLLSSDEIATLAGEAERVWLMSMRLREAYEGGDEIAKSINPERLRKHLMDSDSRKNLLEELASHELAELEFRPWDQWRKSAGKMMSPGLLAMSIGAPKTLAFDSVLANTSAPAIR